MFPDVVPLVLADLWPFLWLKSGEEFQHRGETPRELAAKRRLRLDFVSLNGILECSTLRSREATSFRGEAV